MYYLVRVDHSGIAAHLTRSIGFLRSAVCTVQWMGLMMICCGMAVKRMGMLGISVRMIKTLTVKVEKVTLFGTGS
jgi:hypothetical protein